MSKAVLKTATKYCADHQLRLTDPRRLVLEIVAHADKPMGAYDILQALGAHLNNPKPPTAYRAIDFWVEHGFLHRIESLNAYIVCGAGHKHTGSQYLICDQCGGVEEIHMCHLPDTLSQKAQVKEFTLKFWNVELHGLCAQCAQGA